MIIYRETDDGWNFSFDTETDKVVAGEFRFVTFSGSPSVEYTSGGFRGVRTISSKEETRERLLPLGFAEVECEPASVKTEDPDQLSPEDGRWLAAQLRPGVDYFQFGDQYIFSLSEDEMNHWLPKLRAWRRGEVE